MRDSTTVKKVDKSGDYKKLFVDSNVKKSQGSSETFIDVILSHTKFNVDTISFTLLRIVF